MNIPYIHFCIFLILGDNLDNTWLGWFQQYILYIVAVSFIGGGIGVPEENHRPVASH